jgi:hypothetical protein
MGQGRRWGAGAWRSGEKEEGREVFGGSAVVMVSCGKYHTTAVTGGEALDVWKWKLRPVGAQQHECQRVYAKTTQHATTFQAFPPINTSGYPKV